jgi:hypothetical protein
VGNYKVNVGGVTWSNYLLEFYSHLTGNTVHVHCKGQSVFIVNIIQNSSLLYRATCCFNLLFTVPTHALYHTLKHLKFAATGFGLI